MEIYITEIKEEGRKVEIKIIVAKRPMAIISGHYCKDENEKKLEEEKKKYNEHHEKMLNKLHLGLAELNQ